MDNDRKWTFFSLSKPENDAIENVLVEVSNAV
jgi:hypothetical protein